jgi:hypothetical protein
MYIPRPAKNTLQIESGDHGDGTCTFEGQVPFEYEITGRYSETYSRFTQWVCPACGTACDILEELPYRED